MGNLCETQILLFSFFGRATKKRLLLACLHLACARRRMIRIAITPAAEVGLKL